MSPSRGVSPGADGSPYRPATSSPGFLRTIRGTLRSRHASAASCASPRTGLRNQRAARVVMFRGGDVGYGSESPEDFWGALRGVWFDPVRFFRRLDPRGGAIRPAIFASVILYLDLLLE